jgi:integrase
VRRGQIQLAAKAGASVKMVQAQLGHSDPALTLRLYQHLFEDDLDALAMRLDFNFGVEANNASDLSRPVDGL